MAQEYSEDDAALVASLTRSVSWDCNLDMTVSPQDLLFDTSVPPSTAFTNLTSPGSALLDTPDTSYQTSPLFEDTPLDTSNDWYSLFPVDSPQTASTIVVHPGGESRRKAPAPIKASKKPSAVAGVTKFEKILPPIVVDEGDVVALKRARNTAAARKSRDKKFKEKEVMESRIRKLELEVEHWKALALASNPDASGL